MKLIVGLGNPGSQYAITRHNVGFMVLDMLAETFPVSAVQSDKIAHLYQATIHNQRVLLLKPQTYMNRSGIAVQEVLRRYQESPENIVVIYDDLDLDIGRLRIRKKGGHGGHKGIKSIIQYLETYEFVRIRIGIGRPNPVAMPEGQPLQNRIVEYVLQPFQQDEQSLIAEVLKRSVEVITLIITDQVDTAMNRYNRLSITQC
jgi:PTH1 family peptidyl-tRNA hydrolase